MKLADLQAKLKALNLSPQVAHVTPMASVVPVVHVVPVGQSKPSRKRKAEQCPYDDVYYTAADLTEADKTAIACFHYAYFMSPAPTYMRPEDHITHEILKKHTLLEWAPYLSAEKQTEIQCLYGV